MDEGDDKDSDSEEEELMISLSDLENVLGFNTCSEHSRKFLLKNSILQGLAMQKKSSDAAFRQKDLRKIDHLPIGEFKPIAAQANPMVSETKAKA